MKSKTISPKIISFSWGRIETDKATYKDAKLFPGGSQQWNWNETGTHHTPGIQPADVQDLLNRKAEIIILSKGINKRLKTAPETRHLLERKDCPYFILQSEKAVKKYNEFCKLQAVGALIHSTC